MNANHDDKATTRDERSCDEFRHNPRCPARVCRRTRTRPWSWCTAPGTAPPCGGCCWISCRTSTSRRRNCLSSAAVPIHELGDTSDDARAIAPRSKRSKAPSWCAPLVRWDAGLAGSQRPAAGETTGVSELVLLDVGESMLANAGGGYPPQWGGHEQMASRGLPSRACALQRSSSWACGRSGCGAGAAVSPRDGATTDQGRLAQHPEPLCRR